MGSFLQKGPLLHYQYGTIEVNKMLVLNCMVLHDAVNMVIKNIYFADKVRLLSVFSPTYYLVGFCCPLRGGYASISSLQEFQVAINWAVISICALMYSYSYFIHAVRLTASMYSCCLCCVSSIKLLSYF